VEVGPIRFPDLAGFGRRNLDATVEEIQDDVVYQVERYSDCPISRDKAPALKAHGSLYTMAAVDPKMMAGIAEAVAKWTGKSFWSFPPLQRGIR